MDISHCGEAIRECLTKCVCVCEFDKPLQIVRYFLLTCFYVRLLMNVDLTNVIILKAVDSDI